ncbi:hypothetical protein PTTG_03506 [Puccinia triticina 1-1 BBBD Race 1]|uniref:Uncharacterized protein n=2 Tax=Puccinia triticina TaxID=208348 RepID=A0A0C4ERT6_PUCT1|nr:uncharacterized protein PtA15_9A572 [Puccinia triticina]OAV97472.1 hypothetical protein PTTG_03506 [Puccinia triticina 1-1 BBBD Race 1]WAQ88445.1 hypothetical protein PtA15_9A572 [Puccinia triticina]
MVGRTRSAQGKETKQATPNVKQARESEARASQADLAALQETFRKTSEQIGNVLAYAIEYPIEKDEDPNFRPLQDFIPVIKVCRIFLNKLSKPTINVSTHPLAQMSPATLRSFSKAMTQKSLLIAVGHLVESFGYDFRKKCPGFINGEMAYDVFDILHPAVDIIKKYLRKQRGATAVTSAAVPSADSLAAFAQWLDDWFTAYNRSVRRFIELYPLPQHLFNQFHAY